MEPVKYEFKLGDCLETIKSISDKSIDIITTSPPYNIGLKYHKYEDKKPREQYLEWIYDIFVELKRVLKDDGSLWIIGSYHNIFRIYLFFNITIMRFKIFSRFS